MEDTTVYRSSDGGIVFVVNSVAIPLPRESAIELVDRMVESDAALASKMASLLSEES